MANQIAGTARKAFSATKEPYTQNPAILVTLVPKSQRKNTHVIQDNIAHKEATSRSTARQAITVRLTELSSIKNVEMAPIALQNHRLL